MKHFTVYDLVIQALLGAILLAAQVALAPLPNIELVSLFCLVYTLIYGCKALSAIAVFVILEGLVYGFGLWWLVYLYIWVLLWAAVMLLRRWSSMLLWALVLGLYGLLFGALCAIPYLFAGGPGAALSWWISGIPYDLLHCVGNCVSVLVLYKPLYYLFNKLAGLQLRREGRTTNEPIRR